MKYEKANDKTKINTRLMVFQLLDANHWTQESIEKHDKIDRILRKVHAEVPAEWEVK